jgi:hypothetical protein
MRHCLSDKPWLRTNHPNLAEVEGGIRKRRDRGEGMTVRVWVGGCGRA